MLFALTPGAGTSSTMTLPPFTRTCFIVTSRPELKTEEAGFTCLIAPAQGSEWRTQDYPQSVSRRWQTDLIEMKHGKENY
jgi:hypothetical protein